MIPRAGEEGLRVSAEWTQSFSLCGWKSSADAVDGCPVQLTPELQAEVWTLTYMVENRRIIYSQSSVYTVLHTHGSPAADPTQPLLCGAAGTTFEKNPCISGPTVQNHVVQVSTVVT